MTDTGTIPATNLWWLLLWVGLAQALIVAALFGFYWIRDRHTRWECEHSRMVPAAVSGPAGFGESLTPAANRTTAILWRCELCSHVQATKLRGTWTYDQVRAWGHGPYPPEGWRPPAEPLALTAGMTP